MGFEWQFGTEWRAGRAPVTAKAARKLLTAPQVPAGVGAEAAGERVDREGTHGWIGVLEHVCKARLREALRRIEGRTYGQFCSGKSLNHDHGRTATRAVPEARTFGGDLAGSGFCGH